MFYCGKYIDNFELAFSQMLEYYGVSPVRHVDCIGFRCFGFRMGDRVRDWFRPMISLPDSVSALSEALRIEFCCEEIACLGQLPERAGGFVLGPVKNGLTAPEAKDYYYDGDCRYLFVEKNERDELKIYDPNGLAGLWVRRDRWDRVLPPQPMFCIWINGDPRRGTHKYKDIRSILQEGLRYHKRICEQEREQLRRACHAYPPSRENMLSLQYGIRNLLLQMDKVFLLSASAADGKAQFLSQYLAGKQALYAAGQRGEPCALPELIGEMWRILSHVG